MSQELVLDWSLSGWPPHVGRPWLISSGSAASLACRSSSGRGDVCICGGALQEVETKTSQTSTGDAPVGVAVWKGQLASSDNREPV